MKIDTDKIWADVKANHARLNGCPMHDFAPVPKYADKPEHPLKDFVCKRCGGRIDAIAMNHYRRGVRDGHAAAAVLPVALKR